MKVIQAISLGRVRKKLSRQNLKNILRFITEIGLDRFLKKKPIKKIYQLLVSQKCQTDGIFPKSRGVDWKCFCRLLIAELFFLCTAGNCAQFYRAQRNCLTCTADSPPVLMSVLSWKGNKLFPLELIEANSSPPHSFSCSLLVPFLPLRL